jgi:hypothetical protein
MKDLIQAKTTIHLSTSGRIRGSVGQGCIESCTGDVVEMDATFGAVSRGPGTLRLCCTPTVTSDRGSWRWPCWFQSHPCHKSETGGGDCDVFVVYPGASIMASSGGAQDLPTCEVPVLSTPATVTNVVRQGGSLMKPVTVPQTTGRLRWTP